MSDKRGAERERAPEQQKSSRFGTVVLALLLLVAGGYGVMLWRQHAQAEAARVAARQRAERVAAAAAARVPPTAELALVRRARRVAAALEHIVSSSRRPILGFAAGPVDTSVTDRREKARAKAYVAFVARVERQLTATTPERPSNWGARSEEVQSVGHYLSAAIGALQEAMPPDHVPPRTDRLRNLDSARGFLAAAHTALSNLPR